MSPSPFLRWSAGVITLFSTAAGCLAQSVTTEPVGFLSDTIPAQSDSAIGVPFTRTPKFQGNIASISGSTITVSGTPNWVITAPKEFEHVPGTRPDSYYIQIGTGTKAGFYAPITNNTANSVTVQLSPGENLTGVAVADKVRIFPFWTPATLFPANWPTGTQVLLFDGNVVGVDNSASRILVFGGGVWRDDDGVVASELLIHPTDSFIVRNNSAGPIAKVITGSVPMIKHFQVISTIAANTSQDVRISYTSPAPEIIGNSALGFNTGDQLLVFPNGPGKDKSASQILVYNQANNKWFDEGVDVTSTFTLQPGQGYVFRKFRTVAPSDVIWQDSQTYNP